MKMLTYNIVDLNGNFSGNDIVLKNKNIQNMEILWETRKVGFLF